jgi:serine O-acetyltransferase
MDVESVGARSVKKTDDVEPGEGALAPIVDALCRENARLLEGHAGRLRGIGLPSRAALGALMGELRAALFPDHFGPVDLRAATPRSGPESLRYRVGATLDAALRTLEDQVHRGLAFAGAPEEDGFAERAATIARSFAARLPAVRALLATDVNAAYEGDPAATSPDEAILCYPGLTAVIHHRIAHELHTLKVPLVPRMIAELAHATTGIDIHPAARIGGAFFIDHGTGVVIGETAVIGQRVRLYQGVTLGAKSFPLDAAGHPMKGVDRHPIVEDDVVVYAGATILGRVTIGRGSSIGGNVWLTRSVAAGSVITQAKSHADHFEAGAGI